MKKIITSAVAIVFLCTYLLAGIAVFAATPETTSDASTPDDLANIGTPYTDNFTKNLLNPFTYDGAHNYIYEGDDAIAGKSYRFDINPSFFSGVYFFGVANKFVANGKYRIKLDYKFISASAPNNFYVGLKNDTTGDQLNQQINFSGNQSGTVYNATFDYNLGNSGNYYVQMFCYDPNALYTLVIDNISIERLYVGDSFYQETASDSSTLNDLAKVGVAFNENFTKGAIGSFYSYDPNHYSIIQDENAIAGKSLMEDFTNSTSGTMYAFATKFKMVGTAKYRLSINYKLLTDTAPSGLYFGFTRDGGANQKNIKMNFTGNVKNTVYTFTADYTLDDFNDYYLQWFNLNGADGSKIVIDNLSIEFLNAETADSSTLSDLKKIGVLYTENFTKNALNMWSYDMNHFSIVEGASSISGKSLVQDFTNAGFGGIYAFATKFNFVAGGTYRLSVKYKVLTDVSPIGMYFGFKNDGGEQVNAQVDFSGKVKDTVYSFTHDYTLGNFSDYYMQWFNVSGTDGSKIAIDTIRLELLDTPSHYTLSYSVSGANMLGGVTHNSNTAAFLNGVQRTSGVAVKLYNGASELGVNDFVGTGTRVEVNNGIAITDYTAVVKGDISGDGAITVADLAAEKAHLLKSSILTNEYLSAGDISGDMVITLSDLLAIKKHILGVSLIG